jgi:hypothetical protein
MVAGRKGVALRAHEERCFQYSGALLSGFKPKQLTHFNSGEIFDFSWTADREHVLMTRGQSKRDIVLLSQSE